MREISEARVPYLRPNNITIENRQKITVTGVVDVVSFNEKEVIAKVDETHLTIFGFGLHIGKLDLDDGILVVDGLIGGVEYAEMPDLKNGQGIFSRLFK